MESHMENYAGHSAYQATLRSSNKALDKASRDSSQDLMDTFWEYQKVLGIMIATICQKAGMDDNLAQMIQDVRSNVAAYRIAWDADISTTARHMSALQHELEYIQGDLNTLSLTLNQVKKSVGMPTAEPAANPSNSTQSSGTGTGSGTATGGATLAAAATT